MKHAKPARADFSSRVLEWFDQNGRKDLPWQHPRTPYRVWISEIMLQQTQVTTVIPYFERFIARFPNIKSLAEASADEVMGYWAGLGYYARARNLHRAAQMITTEHRGKFPQEFDAVQALPGIGRSTAGAILAQAFGQQHAILDGNVKRLLCRYHAVDGWPGDARVVAKLWKFAEAHTPTERLADYTQAVMDLGATVCARRTDCPRCPLNTDCVAHARGEQSRYPQSRPRKARPQRETRMLLLERAPGEVFLQRRPPAGIWGGLWCLPEIADDLSIADFCRNTLAAEVEETGALAEIRHGFTHFDLDIHPVRAKLLREKQIIMEGGASVWYKVAGLSNKDGAIALPAPVHKLLRSYQKEAES